LTNGACFCYFLKCPYCNPSPAPRYDKIKDNRDTGAKKLYWKSLSLKNIEITNWVLKEEIYAKCKECNYEWCDDINNILTDICPKCKHGKIDGNS
jgi:predicted Zn-ribbon and HTH transcriptional regulator